MAEKQADFTLRSVQKYVTRGILTVIPFWVTWLVIDFLLSLLSGLGRPVVERLSGPSGIEPPGLVRFLVHPWTQSLLGILLILLGLYLLGWCVSRVVGRQILNAFDALMVRIPLVERIYGAVKQLLSILDEKPDGVERVVMINFPSNEMKTIGLVTRTFRDKDTGRELAAVYVPTTPNPTSGYLEIVPLENVVSTDMTVDEAMSFIVSGGAVAPDEVNYDKSVAQQPKKSEPIKTPSGSETKTDPAKAKTAQDKKPSKKKPASGKKKAASKKKAPAGKRATKKRTPAAEKKAQ